MVDGLTPGEAEAAVDRAVHRIRASKAEHEARSGGFDGIPAGEGIPEPEAAGTTFGVNRTWLRIARRAVRRAFGRSSHGGARHHGDIKT